MSGYWAAGERQSGQGQGEVSRPAHGWAEGGGRGGLYSGCRGASARRASGGVAGGPSTGGSGKQCEWERGLVGRDVRVPRKP